MQNQEIPVIHLGELFKALLRYWWVIIAAAAIGGSAGWALQPNETPVYASETTVLVKEGVDTSSLTGDIAKSRQLAATYIRLITTPAVLELAATRLGPEETIGGISVQIVPDTQFLNIRVEDTDPSRAARIANAVTAAFIEHTRATRLADLANLEQIAAAQGITDISGVISSQLATIETVQLIESATISTTPLGESSNLPIPGGIFIGFMIGAGLALGISYLRDSLPSEERLEERLGASNLGTIYQWRDPSNSANEQAFLITSDTVHADSYRGLASNVIFGLGPADRKVLMVTSPVPAEGKTRTSLNLAIALSERGHRVVLVDADFRKPRLDSMVPSTDLPGANLGLSSFLAGLDIDGHRGKDIQVEALGRQVTPMLRLIVAGPSPPNPTSLLSSPRLNEVIDHLRTKYEYVILDTAPVLVVPDTPSIVSVCDAFLLVVSPRKSRLRQVVTAAKILRSNGLEPIGYVTNGARRRQFRLLSHFTGGGKYRYYGEFYGTQNSAEVLTFSAARLRDKPKSLAVNVRGKLSRLFMR